MPHRIQFRKCELPEAFKGCNNPKTDALRHKVREAAREAYGVVVNSFQELDAEYVKEYKRVTGQKVWCVGPVSLSNKDDVDKAQRGNDKYHHQEEEYMKWLDSWPERSVIYVCLGSLNRVTPEQLMELGLGLEATKRPFIWVLRGAYKREEMENLLKEDGLEERVRGRGILIRGWVAQILILSHRAIGAFLTHCGWNSTLEGICSGVPMVTFPLFSEQFYNEKIVVEIVGTGVRIGVEIPVRWGDEDRVGVLVKRNRIVEAIEMCMEGSEEGDMRRNRAIQLGKMARKATEEQGSSYHNISCLIQDIMDH
ncbi:UDP-glycosyltransferase 73C3-like [Senna tora]|uniref:UDP-glycosyltransferase 73C3-like n=1 Tax=Senna tora TaxID=362788 RepID=A0A834SKU7_9FABA|nr:UDP-glycosyltransferase 73C3-like [Senna tora]